MTQEAKAKELSQDRGFSGIAKKDNLADWAARARDNSYSRDKAQARHDLASEGCAKDYKEAPDFPVKQRQTEGRGWADMKPTTADNTYTGSKK